MAFDFRSVYTLSTTKNMRRETKREATCKEKDKQCKFSHYLPFLVPIILSISAENPMRVLLRSRLKARKY